MQNLDLIILGSGCAGHTAAIYSARANLQPLVLEGEEIGGQLSLTSMVENYPGFPDGIDGFSLIDNMKKQAMRFGAVYEMEAAAAVDLSVTPFQVTTKNNKSYGTKSLIIATGARARMLNVPGEKELFGKGVSSCATCDGAFYRDKKVVVVGGGDTAMEDALFLTRFASEVEVFHRRDQFRASKIMQDRVLQHPKIKVSWNSEIIEIVGEAEKVQKVIAVSHEDGNPGKKISTAGSLENSGCKTSEIACDGVFLAIGHIPNTEFLHGQLAANEDGYLNPVLKPGECATSDIYTNVPGVFAAGDVVDWKFQQAVTAAGMGCKAAMAAEVYLADQE